MGRIVFAEERLDTYLLSVAKPDGYTIGLILGQNAGQKDFVVHLAKTPPPIAKNVVEETLISSPTSTHENTTNKCIASVKDIPESWVADHAKHVTRMLPGGMSVLGIFIAGAGDTLNDNSNVQKVRSILSAINKNLSWNKYLCGSNNGENIILSFNSITQKYLCKSVDVSRDGILKPAEWKFQARATQWHQLETLISFDRLFLIAMDKEPESLKEQLQDILKNVSDMVDSSLVVIEGEARPPDYAVESIGKKQKDRKDCKGSEKVLNDRTLEVNLYIPCPTNISTDIKITVCNASIRLVGQLASRTFVHQKANVQEATMAVKQDIIRSLASRLEMHWDSLIEEETGSPEENITLHEPPRRVLIALPQSKITLSDYLFPGEGPQEALISLQELLDLEVQESNVQKEIELQVDPMEFYCQSDVDIVPIESGKDESRSQQISVYITGLGVTLIILIAAILIYQLS